MEFNTELLEKAKEAKSAEELLSLAKENGMELTEGEAEEYFTQLNKSGELSDEELDNVAGGGCHAKDGRLVVTAGYTCEDFTCRICGSHRRDYHSHVTNLESRSATIVQPTCNGCKYMTIERGLYLCNHPDHRK